MKITDLKKLGFKAVRNLDSGGWDYEHDAGLSIFRCKGNVTNYFVINSQRFIIVNNCGDIIPLSQLLNYLYKEGVRSGINKQLRELTKLIK